MAWKFAKAKARGLRPARTARTLFERVAEVRSSRSRPARRYFRAKSASPHAPARHADQHAAVGAPSSQGRQSRRGEAEYVRLPEESPESQDEADLDTHRGTVTDRAICAAAQAADDA